MMSLSFYINDVLNGNLKVLDDLTTNVKQIEDDLLKDILKLNADTEYLQSFLHGSSDKELFKTNVPVVCYEDVKPYIDRVTNGEPSNVLSALPITGFISSSGTSGGKPKIFPLIDKYLETIRFAFDLLSLVISTHVDGVEQGKGLMFLSTRSESSTAMSYLPVTSSFNRSKYFRNPPSFWYNSYTSPDEVILCPDQTQSLYCHLLCGLVQRDDVVRIGSTFSIVLIRAIGFLEKFWQELCSNIRSGQVSDWITDLSCKASVLTILGGPNPELADLIEQICSQESWEGIIRQLWPNAKYIESIFTGQMVQYVPLIEFYSNKLLLVTTCYGSSESAFGMNLNPLCKPEDVSFTFLPNVAYFEFLPVDEEDNKYIVDLTEVKLGCYYMPLVTTYSGLYRYKVDDIIEATGFYNDAPQFRFARRKNLALSIQMEETTEEDILKAVTNAKLVLEESSDWMLKDFTSYADISTTPGHYVLFWELKTKIFNNNNTTKLDDKVLVECCYVVEESLDAFYKIFRSKEGSIGALEIRVVQNGTFDALADFFVSRGGSVGQYKTPISIKFKEALEVLEAKVIARFFSEKLALL